MSVTLYYGSGSAYAWRVWLALEHKGVAHEWKLLSFSEGGHKAPEYTKLNPRQRVPTLIDGDFVLRESSAILEYVEDRWPQAPLFAQDIQQRATQRRMIREADNYVGTKIEHLFGAVFAPPEKSDAAALGAAVQDVQEELLRWEPEFKDDYLSGAAISAADVTLYPHLAIIHRFARRKPEAIPSDIYPPKLGAWMARMQALPVVQKTWPPHWK
jgi:glutathione S-transferase